MKTILISIALILSTLTGISQSNEFAGAMGEALGQFAGCKSISDYQAAGNRFSLIAEAEKKEWLPYYYHSFCYIMMSFMEPGDAAKKDSYLDEAETVDFTVAGSGANPANSADFSATSGTVTLAAGQATTTLTINVNGDLTGEPDEGFTVTLSNPSSGMTITG